MNELGSRRMTNVLVEGGSQLMGGLWDHKWIDEIHVFVAPKVLGGEQAIAPISGRGIEKMSDAASLANLQTSLIEGGDVYLRGYVDADD